MSFVYPRCHLARSVFGRTEPEPPRCPDRAQTAYRGGSATRLGSGTPERHGLGAGSCGSGPRCPRPGASCQSPSTAETKRVSGWQRRAASTCPLPHRMPQPCPPWAHWRRAVRAEGRPTGARAAAAAPQTRRPALIHPTRNARRAPPAAAGGAGLRRGGRWDA